jgi:hypothetical protein
MGARARLSPFAQTENRRGSRARPRRLKTAGMPSLLNLRRRDLIVLTGRAPHSRLTCTRSEDIRRRKTHPAKLHLLTVASASPSVGILIFGKGQSQVAQRNGAGSLVTVGQWEPSKRPYVVRAPDDFLPATANSALHLCGGQGSRHLDAWWTRPKTPHYLGHYAGRRFRAGSLPRRLPPYHGVRERDPPRHCRARFLVRRSDGYEKPWIAVVDTFTIADGCQHLLVVDCVFG